MSLITTRWLDIFIVADTAHIEWFDGILSHSVVLASIALFEFLTLLVSKY
jgi:hypothetical protein